MIKRTNVKDKAKLRRKFDNRQKNTARFQLPKNADLDYKNFSLLQKYLNDRGKIVPRRISGVTAKEQRQLVVSIKRARHLALLTSGGMKK
ncbi:MAG: 30S ribosomal protein S18 [Candidatus Omnitrophica bacterium]|nr:30S ribosomal protein S18 [Candidatus Omnitrophota bacterium]